MPDTFAGQGAAAASSTEPGQAATGIEDATARLKSELEAQFEERIKGFQRVIGSKDERLSALEKELRQLKTASLTPEELEELQVQEKDQRIADLESRLELQGLASQFPDEMPHFQRLLDAETAEDQLKVLRELRSAISGQSTASGSPKGDPAADDLDVPGVDPNNPRRPVAGLEMSDDLADQILKGWGSRPLRQGR